MCVNRHAWRVKINAAAILIVEEFRFSYCIQAITDLNNGNRLIRNSSRISNILNDYFVSVGHKLANQSLDSQKHFSDFLIKSKCPLDSFCFNLITPTEVKLEILALLIHKAHGLYS